MKHRTNVKQLFSNWLFRIAIACVATLPLTSMAAEETPTQLKLFPVGKSRSFRFRYGVTITNLLPNKTAHVWIPIAQSDRHQRVSVQRVQLPGKYRRSKESRYGNSMFFLRADADAQGRIPIVVDYEIQRIEVGPKNGEKLSANDRKLYLASNRFVPIGGKPFKLLMKNKQLGASREAIRTIYDRVDQHVRYHKPTGGEWGRGDADWVCDSRFGNCSDFHSLFISLCRSNDVPARFRIGFPISNESKGKVGGYHCWAEFADGARWSSVDISEADKDPSRKDYFFGQLPPDRVAFTIGRDLILEPKQKSGALNFFIYPHVEVEGKLHTKMEKLFSFSTIR